jgi:hypothetical protein
VAVAKGNVVVGEVDGTECIEARAHRITIAVAQGNGVVAAVVGAHCVTGAIAEGDRVVAARVAVHRVAGASAESNCIAVAKRPRTISVHRVAVAIAKDDRVMGAIQISTHSVTSTIAELNRVAGAKIRDHAVGGAVAKGNCGAVNEPESWIKKSSPCHRGRHRGKLYRRRS